VRRAQLSNTNSDGHRRNIANPLFGIIPPKAVGFHSGPVGQQQRESRRPRRPLTPTEFQSRASCDHPLHQLPYEVADSAEHSYRNGNRKHHT
jgi:hypothetical protein